MTEALRLWFLLLLGVGIVERKIFCRDTSKRRGITGNTPGCSWLAVPNWCGQTIRTRCFRSDPRHARDRSAPHDSL